MKHAPPRTSPCPRRPKDHPSYPNQVNRQYRVRQRQQLSTLQLSPSVVRLSQSTFYDAPHPTHRLPLHPASFIAMTHSAAHRLLRLVTVLLFAIMICVIGIAMIRPWIYIPNIGNIPFTLFFTAFALTHAAATLGPRRAAWFFALAAAISWCFEEVGVATGLIYGSYHYSAMLGARLGFVPILIPLAWFMMLYPSWRVAQTLMPRPSASTRWPFLLAQSAVAAMVMTAWDAVMDPGMAASGNWIWRHPGPYFGVPLQNYAGWLLTTITIYFVAGLVFSRSSRPPLTLAALNPLASDGYAALPVLLYAWFALRYIVNEPQGVFHIIALFSMGFPAILATLHLLTRRQAASA